MSDSGLLLNSSKRVIDKLRLSPRNALSDCQTYNGNNSLRAAYLLVLNSGSARYADLAKFGLPANFEDLRVGRTDLADDPEHDPIIHQSGELPLRSRYSR